MILLIKIDVFTHSFFAFLAVSMVRSRLTIKYVLQIRVCRYMRNPRNMKHSIKLRGSLSLYMSRLSYQPHLLYIYQALLPASFHGKFLYSCWFLLLISLSFRHCLLNRRFFYQINSGLLFQFFTLTFSNTLMFEYFYNSSKEAFII